jgi:hypothetical protein
MCVRVRECAELAQSEEQQCKKANATEIQQTERFEETKTVNTYIERKKKKKRATN